MGLLFDNGDRKVMVEMILDKNTDGDAQGGEYRNASSAILSGLSLSWSLRTGPM